MLSQIFNISTKGLDVYRRALDVTAHNISNSGNKNYSRQVVNIETAIPEFRDGIIWGSGSTISQVTRVRDQFIDNSLRQNFQKNSFYDQQSILLGRAEQAFTEPSDFGLSNIISSFFNSFNKLAVSPDSSALRENVIFSAQSLVTKIKDIHQNIEAQKDDIFNDYKSKVNELNSSLKKIKDLNIKISQQLSAGLQPNDLMDKRDVIIDKISKLTEMQIYNNKKGSVNISIGGVLAVDSNISVDFKMKLDNGKLNLTTDGTNNLNLLKSGELGALSEVYSNKIPNYLSNLDNITNTLFTSVNNVHTSGYTLENVPQTGIDFFSSVKNGELEINNKIINDPNKIAVSADGSPGNGDLAVKMSLLNNQKLIDGNTLIGKYSNLISTIGGDKSNADNMSASTNLVIKQLEDQKTSYSGVSVDEEMSNVIKFQRSYDASAKLISIADKMLQTLINMV